MHTSEALRYLAQLFIPAVRIAYHCPLPMPPTPEQQLICGSELAHELTFPGLCRHAMWSILRNASVAHATKMRWCGEGYNSDSNRSGSLHDMLPSRIKINQESGSKLASPNDLAGGHGQAFSRILGGKRRGASNVLGSADQSNQNPQYMISIYTQGRRSVHGVRIKIRERQV